jgi:hypothetical protein
MPVVLLGDRIPSPVRPFEVLEDDPRVLVPLGVVGPDVELTRGAALGCPASPLEPRVLIGGVVADELGDDLEAAQVRLADQVLDVSERAIVGVDRGVVGDVVAVVLQR